MTEMHTHRSDSVVFLWNRFAFQPGLKSFLVYIIFRILTQSSWLYFSPASCVWKRLLSSMLPTKLTQHFCWGNTWILFTLGNRGVSCYATHATYVVCQRNLPENIQHSWHIIQSQLTEWRHFGWLDDFYRISTHVDY